MCRRYGRDAAPPPDPRCVPHAGPDRLGQAGCPAADEFAIPQLTAWQRRILATAFKRLGYPYIWGGTSDSRQSLFGVSVPGGYDCSGFVRRVYKLQRYAGGDALPATLQGRTTFAMSGEVTPVRPIGLLELQPADVVFFGDKGPKSKPAQVNHMGIYVGTGWFVHSSGRGVALERLAGWYQARFAWAASSRGRPPFRPALISLESGKKPAYG